MSREGYNQRQTDLLSGSIKPLQARPRTFSIEAYWETGVAYVVPVGEMDLATVDLIDEELQALHADGERNIVLDLRRLTFIDSTGIRLILRWDRLTRHDGYNFALIQGGPEIEYLFELTDLRDCLPFVEAADIGEFVGRQERPAP